MDKSAISAISLLAPPGWVSHRWHLRHFFSVCVKIGRGTAGPSAPLRSGRDDKGESRASIRIELLVEKPRSFPPVGMTISFAGKGLQNRERIWCPPLLLRCENYSIKSTHWAHPAYVVISALRRRPRGAQACYGQTGFVAFVVTLPFAITQLSAGKG
jgi:hypothetical protein